MSNFRRSHNGQLYFFTVVTDQRQPILTTDLGRQALREAISTVRKDTSFSAVAFVLLPDHLHTIWELPQDGNDYSTHWRHIKTSFTKTWRRQGGETTPRSPSRESRGEQGVWQRRFFEHTCRNDNDLKRCVDYIHVNPLKHGLVNQVIDWPWPSFHRYVAEGEYTAYWGDSSQWYGEEFKHFE